MSCSVNPLQFPLAFLGGGGVFAHTILAITIGNTTSPIYLCFLSTPLAKFARGTNRDKNGGNLIKNAMSLVLSGPFWTPTLYTFTHTGSKYRKGSLLRGLKLLGGTVRLSRPRLVSGVNHIASHCGWLDTNHHLYFYPYGVRVSQRLPVKRA